MRWFGAVSLALFLTLSLVATTLGQHIQVGPVTGVRPGTPPGIHIGNSIAGNSIGFRNPNFHHHHYPRSLGYVSSYWPYYYAGYAPYGDYDYDDAPYTGYIGGTFNTSPYAGYPYAPQYAPPPNYYSPQSSPPPVNSGPEPESYQQQKSNPRRPANDEFAEPTVLVFRDGHRREIANYAIMGSTLFVLSGPRSRIPVAELDVPATERVNQDRGIAFSVPKKAQ